MCRGSAGEREREKETAAGRTGEEFIDQKATQAASRKPLLLLSSLVEGPARDSSLPAPGSRTCARAIDPTLPCALRWEVSAAA